MIFIRCDASVKIGSGHIMRCLNLAEKFKQKDGQTHFICRALSGNLIDYIRGKDYPILILDNAEKIDQSNEAKLVLKAIASVSSETNHKMIVDHYDLDCGWHRIVRERCRSIIVVDDLANRYFDCDLLINQNIYHDKNHLYNQRVSEKTIQCIGPEYALLSDSYVDNRGNALIKKTDIQRIVIFFGGSDLPNLTLKAIQALLSVISPMVKVDTVIGRSYPYQKELKQAIASHNNIELHQHIEDFASFCKGSDLMIGAGGTSQL